MPLPLNASRFARVLLLLALLAGYAVASAKIVVRYPKQESANVYPLQVLQLALQEAGVAFELQASNNPMPQGRALQQLAKHDDVNLVWTMTSIERERTLLPIRIPIDKGLLGWRLMLVHKQQSDVLSKVKTLEHLRALTAGQGHDWPDTEILRFNGIKVETTPSFEGLFRMLDYRRFDYFPRSVIEIWDEQNAFDIHTLTIDRHLIIHYPTAFYFFVAKENAALAQTIETGLNKAIANGKFEQLFQKTYGEHLKRAGLKSRTRLELTNPLLPPATPLGRKELWLKL